MSALGNLSWRTEKESCKCGESSLALNIAKLLSSFPEKVTSRKSNFPKKQLGLESSHLAFLQKKSNFQKKQPCLERNHAKQPDLLFLKYYKLYY